MSSRYPGYNGGGRIIDDHVPMRGTGGASVPQYVLDAMIEIERHHEGIRKGASIDKQQYGQSAAVVYAYIEREQYAADQLEDA